MDATLILCNFMLGPRLVQKDTCSFNSFFLRNCVLFSLPKVRNVIMCAQSNFLKNSKIVARRILI